MSETAEKTDPKLWERVKQEVTRGDKGGEPGQWSARKAQLAVQDYKKQGGGYRGAKDDENSLSQWQREDWGTKSGQESGDTGERYLPKKAREALSVKEYATTTAKKRADKRAGKQFSKQPDAAAKKAAQYRDGSGALGEKTKADLVDEARDKGLSGYSKMNKAELQRALAG